MGGMGSGRKYHIGAKRTVENFRPLDIRRWQQEKAFFEGSSFSWVWYQNEQKIGTVSVRVESNRVILAYQYQTGDREWIPAQYTIDLTWTDCHLGGRRPWFLCPGNGCGRRVAILYGGAVFVCRQCHQLVYSSQREPGYDRLARRANRIRKKLEWKLGILNGKGWTKPKGMHWKTYWRLMAEHDRLVATSCLGIAKKANLLGLAASTQEEC